jgi:hypothetical protein
MADTASRAGEDACGDAIEDGLRSARGQFDLLIESVEIFAPIFALTRQLDLMRRLLHEPVQRGRGRGEPFHVLLIEHPLLSGYVSFLSSLQAHQTDPTRPHRIIMKKLIESMIGLERIRSFHAQPRTNRQLNCPAAERTSRLSQR